MDFNFVFLWESLGYNITQLRISHEDGLSLKYPVPQKEVIPGNTYSFFDTQETEIQGFILKQNGNLRKSRQFSWDKILFLAQIQIRLHSLFLAQEYRSLKKHLYCYFL